MCVSYIRRINKAITILEFSSKFVLMLLQICTMKHLQPVEQQGIYLAAGSIDGFGECLLTVTGSREAEQAPPSQPSYGSGD